MRMIIVHILAIASLASIACSLLGTFLILRGVALMSDAISHAVLPGIVIMFLVVHSLESPLLIIGASLAGLATVLVTEYIIQTKRLKKDAAIGFVFPLFFSVGILLICKYAQSVHLDTDMVILGELALCPFNRLIIFGKDYGPCALWSMGFITLLNGLFIFLFYKELSLSTFDPTLACILQFRPKLIYYLLMILTSITAVGTFNIVGSIVVVTLMLTPPATAYLLTNRLPHLIRLSLFIGIVSTFLGYAMAHSADVSIAGSIASTNGFIFFFTFLCAPHSGLLRSLLFERNQQLTLSIISLCHYLIHKQTSSAPLISHDLNWSMRYTQKIIFTAQKKELINHLGQNITITHHGIELLAQYCP